MIITISGLPGSGKTTTGKLVAEKLGLKFISTGYFFRQMASEKGMTLNEFSEYAEEHPEVDQELDKRMQKLSQEEDNLVIEGRLVAWMCKSDFKVWLEASAENRAPRVHKREEEGSETKEEMIARETSEAKRYKEIHNIDINDKSVYDLVVDSDSLTVPEMAEEILEKVKERSS